MMVAGMTTYYQDETGLECAQFNADFSTPVTKPYEINAKVQRMRDGSLYITEKPKRLKSRAMCLCKTAHGSASATFDKAWQVNFKIWKREGLNPVEVLKQEMPEMIAKLTEIFGEIKAQRG